MGTLLSLEGVRKEFRVTQPGRLRRAALPAVRNVDLSIGAGECVGLVGESGCGKTTLGRMVAGLDRPTGGQVVCPDDRRPRVQMIFQDVTGSLDPRYTIAESIAEPLRVADPTCRGQALDAQVATALDAVELPAAVGRRFPSELSGGQRQRVSIARVIVVAPDLIVCDEPVSALDVSVQAQILNLLRRLQHERGMAYLFIAHGLAAVKYMSDRVVVMYFGLVVEEGPADEVFAHPRHPYTRALLDSHPAPGRARRRAVRGELPDPLEPPTGCAFRSRCPAASDACATEPPLQSVGEVLVRCHHPLDAAERAA